MARIESVSVCIASVPLDNPVTFSDPTGQEIGSLVGASFRQIRGRLHRIRS